MMIPNFDQPIDRRGTDSLKWRAYPEDVLPLWVADMDFPSPEPVIRALRERVEHGVFGYALEPTELRAVLVTRLQERYGWAVTPEQIVFLPGVVSGFNLVVQALTRPGDGLVVQPPVYPPIVHAHEHAGLQRRDAPVVQDADGRWGMDWDAFEAAAGKPASAFLLCNPHNPTGRVFTREELARMAETCLRNDLWIISDEIHCDLVYPGARHTPIASLAPEIARRTVTLMAPSKTYNIAGLGCSFAILPDPELARQMEQAGRGLMSHVNLLGYTAALAAYRDGQPWLDALLAYLTGNRDYLAAYLAREIPELRMTLPESTYLAWLDCRAVVSDHAGKFFQDQARVGFFEGEWFGPGGAGFTRLNFGCPRATLHEGLERMKRAVRERLARA